MSNGESERSAEALASDLDASIDALREALKGSDTGMIARVRATYGNIRTRFFLVLPAEHDDKKGPHAAVITKDDDIVKALREIDASEKATRAKLQSADTRTDRQRTEHRGRLPRRIPAVEINMGSMKNVDEILYFLLKAFQKEPHSIGVLLENMAYLIGYALAWHECTSAHEETLHGDVDRETREKVSTCMDTFGDELRSLATDRAPENTERWLDLAKRIGESRYPYAEFVGDVRAARKIKSEMREEKR